MAHADVPDCDAQMKKKTHETQHSADTLGLNNHMKGLWGPVGALGSHVKGLAYSCLSRVHAHCSHNSFFSKDINYYVQFPHFKMLTQILKVGKQNEPTIPMVLL